MRIQSWCATALAAAGLLHGAAADETTFTITRTVERVVDTTTATWSATTRPSSQASHAPSYAPSAYGNGTASTHATGTHTGTGAWKSSTPSQSVPVVQATGAAAHLRFDTAGLAAVVGLVSFVAL